MKNTKVVKVEIKGWKDDLRMFIKKHLDDGYCLDPESIIPVPKEIEGCYLGEWRRENWGTNSKPRFISYDMMFADKDHTECIQPSIKMVFETDFSPPKKVLDRMIETWPNLDFNLSVSNG